MIEFEERFLKRLITILIVLDGIVVRVLFFQLISIFEKLHSKFEGLFIE